MKNAAKLALALSRGGYASPTLDQILFGAGENGFLCRNFADKGQLFQSPAGLAPVVNDSDPAGVLIDGRSGQTYAQILAAATELMPDGVLTASGNNANCNDSVVGNAVRLTSTISMAGARTRYWTLAGLTIGTAYRVSVDVVGRGGTLAASTTNRLSVRTAADADVQTSQVDSNLDTKAVIFVATATSHRIQLRWDLSGGDLTTYVEFANLTVKAVSGNHGIQATAGNRGLWHTGNFITTDGSNDSWGSAFSPSSATITYLARLVPNPSIAAVVNIVGGNGGSNLRSRLSINASGVLCAGVGDQTESTILGGSDVRGQNIVAGLVYDGSTVALYRNGVSLYSAAQVGSANTGVGTGIAARNNNNANFQGFIAADFYSVAATTKALTPAEIAQATALM